MTETNEGMRARQSNELLEELLALPLDERWRLIAERDLRLRRLVDRDFALFCRELGIRPPSGLSVISPDWALPAPIPAQWSQGQVVNVPPRWTRAALRLALLTLAILAVAAQGYVGYQLFYSDAEGKQQQAALQIAAAAGDASQGARLMTMAVADLEQLRLSMAMEQLRGALINGAPFESALGVVAASPRLNDQILADLRALKPLAAGGVPSRAHLRRSFAETNAAAAATIDTSLPAAACRQLSGLLTLNLCDAAAATHTQNTLALALAAVARDDLADAVILLNQLTEPASLSTAPWIAAAQARLLADRVAAALSQLMFTG